MMKSIICLTGPPGVGKTSIGRSVAEALGREYVRISLRFVMSLKLEGIENLYRCDAGKNSSKSEKAGTSNPVFVLDEIDKLSVSSQGDPSALLEVLDPEQNNFL
jgi:ATP-dependent Lon protease